MVLFSTALSFFGQNLNWSRFIRLLEVRNKCPLHSSNIDRYEGYLEMDQRAGYLTGRLAVIKDLLDVLKNHLSSGHGEKLEWIGMSPACHSIYMC